MALHDVKAGLLLRHRIHSARVGRLECRGELGVGHELALLEADAPDVVAAVRDKLVDAVNRVHLRWSSSNSSSNSSLFQRDGVHRSRRDVGRRDDCVEPGLHRGHLRHQLNVWVRARFFPIAGVAKTHTLASTSVPGDATSCATGVRWWKGGGHPGGGTYRGRLAARQFVRPRRVIRLHAGALLPHL